jgi:hypothetical protein
LKRPLTQEERNLVIWLLQHSHIDASFLLPQVDHLNVASKCTCGCPTIDFGLDGFPVERRGEGLVSDWLAEIDGELVGVMLFQSNDRISSLEIYSLGGKLEEKAQLSGKPFALPAIESMKGA